MAVDWFRSPEWDADAQVDFAARLRRARPHNRPQYTKIKALALEAAGHTAAAEELLRSVIDQYPESWDAAFCAERLGDRRLALGQFSEAEQEYRRSLDLRPDMNATTGEVHLGLAESLLGQGRFEEALQALDYRPVARLTLNHGRCRWNAALAEAALGVGERTVATEAAARAIALLDAPDQFSRHPGVGRAVLTNERLARMRAIASGQPPTDGSRRRWRRRR